MKHDDPPPKAEPPEPDRPVSVLRLLFPDWFAWFDPRPKPDDD